MNGHILVFTALVACLTCLLFGLAPAFGSTRGDAAEAMKVNGRTMSSGRDRFGIRQMLVVTQVALSLILLVGALLFSGSLRNLLAVDAGFQSNGILVADVGFSRVSVPEKQRDAYKRDLLERLRAIPGVTSGAQVEILPLSGASTSNSVWPDNMSPVEKHNSQFNFLSEGYFRTMGISFLAGRDFNDGDTLSSPKVAVVNQSFARLLRLGSNPVGQSFRRQATPLDPETSFEIVGLVKDTKYRSLRDESIPIAFLASAQGFGAIPSLQVVIRSASSATGGISSAIRTLLAQINPRINVDFQGMDAVVREGLMRDRLLAALSGFFGVLAVLIAAVGLYGVMSYAVVRRTNEVGLRMALGAGRGNILALILRQSAILVFVGLAVGIPLSLAVATAARSILFGLKPYDPRTMLFAITVLAAVALAATYLPAHRAATLDPMKALREE